ncbi:Homeodomain-containing protein [Artemisia annua]|uniref:Homeodomain-containing protein n=1 Tax=Artemisia annua TaxID=35608 RepID=A0A2U1KSD9_ARTAN|nr:Homeodomain-containing protein [Artemisia annua]
MAQKVSKEIGSFGEQMYYFPQGHLEHIKASTQDAEDYILRVNKILRAQLTNSSTHPCDKGQEVGKGSIHLANGTWFGRNLEELRLCVVDVKVLKVGKWSELTHPCDDTSRFIMLLSINQGRTWIHY